MRALPASHQPTSTPSPNSTPPPADAEAHDEGAASRARKQAWQRLKAARRRAAEEERHRAGGRGRVPDRGSAALQAQLVYNKQQ